MMLCRLVGVGFGVCGVTIRCVRVMGRLLVIAGFVMLCRFVVMLRRLPVVMSGLLMVCRAWMIRHSRLLFA